MTNIELEQPSLTNSSATHTPIPREAQEAFSQFVTSLPDKIGERIISPEHLLEITLDENGLIFDKKRGNIVSRTYYRYVYWQEPPVKVATPMSVESRFILLNGHYQPLDICHIGEDQMELARIEFHDYREEEVLIPNRIEVYLRLGGRELNIKYDENGNIRYLGHSVGLSWVTDRKLALVENPTEPHERSLQGLMDGGMVALLTPIDTYQAIFNRQAGVIELKREKAGKEEDVAEIPVRIDREEILGNLFTLSHFDNPFKTNPKEDIWKNTDLFNLSGVKWERS